MTMPGVLPGRRGRARWAVVLLLLTVVAAGCTSGGEPSAGGTVAPAPESPAAPATPEPSPTAGASPTPSATPSDGLLRGPLEARYYQDSDGNVVPDFVEAELGYDPMVDDCAAEGCPAVGELAGQGSVGVDQNVLLILDSSGSMAADDGTGTIKIDAARAALERYAFGAPPNFDLGLQVYGHRGSNDEADKAESCAGIELFAPLGEFTADTAAATLSQFQPTGYTPVAGALDKAAEAFAGTEGAANRVVMVTDGEETCGGDPVASAARLKQSGIAVTVDVVGFDITADEAAALRQVAEVTGGTYTDAQTAGDLEAYVDSLLARSEALLETYRCRANTAGEESRCYGEFGSAVNLEMGRGIALIDDPERAEELAALRERITGYSAQRRRDRERLAQDELAQLFREWQETQYRYQTRYGREISSVEPCPAVVVAMASMGIGSGF